jgi:hypothetical protein
VVVNSDIVSLINNSTTTNNLNNSITTRGATRSSRPSTEFRPASRHISLEIRLTTMEVVPDVATVEEGVNGNTNGITETTGYC